MNINEELDKINQVIDEWTLLEKERKHYLKIYNDCQRILSAISRDRYFLQTSLSKLNKFYSEHKINLTEELCSELTDIINLIFNNKYDFYFEIETKRQIQYTSLVDRNTGGSVSVACGGAVSQMIPFISTIAIIKQKGSELLWLDEAFSNFGNEEIKKIPDILDMLDNVQLIFTEHKTDMDLNNMSVIEVVRNNTNNSKGYSTVLHHDKEKKEQIEKEILDKEVNEKDIEILKMFNLYEG